MPTAAPHPCTAVGCGALVPRSRARCDVHEHKRQVEDRAARGSAHQRGYDQRWRTYRLRFIAEHPLCDDCAAQGKVVPTEVVDHVTPHKGDQQLFWDERNHRSLCKACHDRRVDEGDFGR